MYFTHQPFTKSKYVVRHYAAILYTDAILTLRYLCLSEVVTTPWFEFLTSNCFEGCIMKSMHVAQRFWVYTLIQKTI